MTNAGMLFWLACVFSAGGLSAVEVSGDWEMAYNYMGDVSYARLTFKVEDGKLSGRLLNVLNLKAW
jgi:hypothetical protein